MEEYSIEVRVMKLDSPDSADQREALSELAWYEQVEAAEKELPILVAGPAEAAQVWQGRAAVDRLAKLAMGVWGIGPETIEEILKAA